MTAWFALGRSGVAAVTAVLIGALLAVQPGARAESQPPPGLPQTVSADTLATWQINGVVWSQVTVGNTVYATGSFTRARPPGVAPGGVGEVDARNIFAFDIRTGTRLASFNHSLNAQGRFVTASPDGTRVYVGGDFTSVDGFARGHVASFETATGALVPTFAPSVSGTVRTLQATNTTVYVGGAFTQAGGQTRFRLASFSASNGTLTGWNPSADDENVWSMVLTPDQSKVVVGGPFTSINNQPAYGMGAVSAATGATLPWAANQLIRVATSTGAITSLRADAQQIYGTAYAYGGPTNFEGVFAADPTTGEVNWVNDCHGDTYDTLPIADVLYSVSHAHDCAWISEFPETSTRTYSFLLASPTFPTGSNLGPDNYGWDFNGVPAANHLHWFPKLNMGTYTGQYQAGWSLTGNSDYLSVGGEFTQANFGAQQGLVRFARPGLAPNKRGMENFDAALRAVSVTAGAARVSWVSQWDMDNANLRYDVYRDGGATPVHTITTRSTFWNRPRLTFNDTGLAPGSQHTYRVRASDPFGNSSTSPESAPVTIASGSLDPYASAVLDDGAASYFRLAEASGSTLVDLAGVNNAVLSGSVTRGTAGAIAGNAATTFTGSATGGTAAAVTAPQTFSVEAWFKTSTSTGGKVVGFGSSQSGVSSRYDRHLYLDNSGRLFFGINDSNNRTVNSPGTYRDNVWHHAVGTQGPQGMSLYVDGKRVGFDSAATVATSYPGYWRIGGDTLSTWPSRPTSNNLDGSIDDVAIYDQVLTTQQVQQHYAASGRSLTVPGLPADAYGQAVYNDNPDLYWRLNETSGSTANDSGRLFTSGIYSTLVGVTRPASGPLTGNNAITLGGNASIGSTLAEYRPTSFSEEIWFKTATNTGGKLIGFGSSSSGSSASADRFVYMTDPGRLRFGVRSRGTNVFIESPTSYNDNTWHHVVATQSSAGMRLYVDGGLVASNNRGGGGNYPGAWRVGGGDSNYGGSTSLFFTGSVDEAAVYSTVLTQPQVAAHYSAAGGVVTNQPPTAAFTSSITNLTASFNGSGSSDPDGTITSYAWNFGDGTTGTGATPSHTYGSNGTYTVTLTVTDNGGLTGSVSHPVTVAAPVPNQPPTAAFTFSSTNLTASFNGSGSSDPDGTITSYAWNFGDGTTGTGATPSHTYASNGTYTVTLTVTDNDGANGSVSKQVAVAAAGGPVLLARDTFTRTLTGGWGAADQGGAWLANGNSTNFTVESGLGQLRMPSAGSGPSSFLPGVSSTDTDLQTRISLDSVPTGGTLGVDQGLLVRRIAGSGDYRAKLRFLPTGEVRIGLSRTNAAGAQTTLIAETTVAGITYAVGQDLVVRVQAFGTSPTTIRAKVWRSGTSEPGPWMVTTTDSTAALQTAGMVGLHSFLAGTVTNAPLKARFDDLVVQEATSLP